MDEQAHYTYEGNVTLSASHLKQTLPSSAEAKVVRPVEIIGIQHLIPIQVRCKQGDDLIIVSAYMDYSTNTVHLPPSSTTELDDPAAFKAALAAYVQQVVLPKPSEPVNLTPEEMESVQGRLDANQSQERFHERARVSRMQDDVDDEDEDDAY